jgi:phosphate-selective porin OprO/OprP
MKKTLCALGLALALANPGLRCEESQAQPGSPDFEQRLKALEDKAAASTAALAAQHSNAGGAALPAFDDALGLSLRSADGQNSLSLRGWIQVQSRNYFGDTVENPGSSTPLRLPVDSFLVNEARLYAEGTLWGNTGYRLLTDYKGGTVSLLDAYVDVSFLPGHNLTLRAGKFKAPIGLERLQDSTKNEFIELGLPSNLAPNRDLGYALSGYVLDRNFLNATAGIFNGSQDGASSSASDSSQADEKTFEGRVFSQPFYAGPWPLVRKLGLGIAGSYGDRNRYQSNGGYAPFTTPTYLSAGQQAFFSYNSSVAVVGRESRLAPQGYWYWRNFGLLGEWIRSYHDVSATPAPTITQVQAEAYQIQAFVVLTGEDASFDGVKPRATFDPAGGTYGALELVARYGDLLIGQSAFSRGTDANEALSANEAQETALGLNWYLNPSLKWQLNWIQTWFHGGGGGSPGKPLNREAEQVALTQIQLAF